MRDHSLRHAVEIHFTKQHTCNESTGMGCVTTLYGMQFDARARSSTGWPHKPIIGVVQLNVRAWDGRPLSEALDETLVDAFAQPFNVRCVHEKL